MSERQKPVPQVFRMPHPGKAVIRYGTQHILLSTRNGEVNDYAVRHVQDACDMLGMLDIESMFDTPQPFVRFMVREAFDDDQNTAVSFDIDILYEKAQEGQVAKFERMIRRAFESGVSPDGVTWAVSAIRKFMVEPHRDDFSPNAPKFYNLEGFNRG